MGAVSELLPLMYEDELNLRQLNQSEYLLKKKHLRDNVSWISSLLSWRVVSTQKMKKEEYLIKRNYEDSLKV